MMIIGDCWSEREAVSSEVMSSELAICLFPPPRQRLPETIKSPPSLSHDKKATQRKFLVRYHLLVVWSFLTSMAAELGDIIGSGRISNRLLPMYLACMGFGIVALLRGLVSHSTKRSPVLARRKRA
ncbi:hypothetical protein YC2023_088609 [Brassica napus]